MPCWDTRRRAFALRSNIDNEGVSSIWRGAFSNACVLILSCSRSCFSSFPDLNFSEESHVSEEISLVMSCTEDISNENNPTGMLLLTAMFLAMESTKAVFPIPGRAAIMTKSEFCRPAVTLSNLSNPVAIQLKPFVSAISSIFFLA